MRRYIERFDENLVSSGYVWQHEFIGIVCLFLIFTLGLRNMNLGGTVTANAKIVYEQALGKIISLAILVF